MNILGLQEGRLRLTEFGNGVDENTAKILEGTGISTQALQEYGAAVARGGEEGQQAYVDVANAVAGIDDALLRNTVGVALFGR